LLDQAEMLGYLPHTAHPRQGWLPRR
jgi:hypothetical protein